MTTMKWFRVGYYLSIFILLFAGLGTGRWEFYFLLMVLLAMVAFAFVLNLWTFFSFSYRYEFTDKRITKGESPTLKIHIHNNKPFSLNSIYATVQGITPSNQVQLQIEVAPMSTICYNIELHCKYRGMYEVGITSLEVTDIFGILPMRFDMKNLPHHHMEQIVVYPRLLRLSTQPTETQDEALFSGLDRRKVSTHGEEYHDIRKYRFGDPFKRIHRIISARKRDLHVRHDDIPPESSTIIVMDTRKNAACGDESLHLSDIACECAVAIADYHLHSGNAVTLLSLNENEPAVEASNPNDFPKLLDYLATMSFDMHYDTSFTLQNDFINYVNVDVIYIISPRCDKTFSDTLISLVKSGTTIRQFVPSLCERNEIDQITASVDGIVQTIVKNVDDIATQ